MLFILDKSSMKKTKKSPSKSVDGPSEMFVFPNYDLPKTKEHDESQCEVEWDSRSPITICELSIGL